MKEEDRELSIIIPIVIKVVMTDSGSMAASIEPKKRKSREERPASIADYGVDTEEFCEEINEEPKTNRGLIRRMVQDGRTIGSNCWQRALDMFTKKEKSISLFQFIVWVTMGAVTIIGLFFS